MEGKINYGRQEVLRKREGTAIRTWECEQGTVGTPRNLNLSMIRNQQLWRYVVSIVGCQEMVFFVVVKEGNHLEGLGASMRGSALHTQPPVHKEVAWAPH